MPLQHASRCWSCVLPMCNDLRFWVCFCTLRRYTNIRLLLLFAIIITNKFLIKSFLFTSLILILSIGKGFIKKKSKAYAYSILMIQFLDGTTMVQVKPTMLYPMYRVDNRERRIELWCGCILGFNMSRQLQWRRPRPTVEWSLISLYVIGIKLSYTIQLCSQSCLTIRLLNRVYAVQQINVENNSNYYYFPVILNIHIGRSQVTTYGRVLRSFRISDYRPICVTKLIRSL